MNTDKTSLENESQPSCLGAVRQRIFLRDGISMSDELFNAKADEFARCFIKSFGCEMIDKLDYFAPMAGDFWQLKYVA